MIRRPPRSTPLYSSAASDVYKRQVTAIRLVTSMSRALGDERRTAYIEELEDLIESLTAKRDGLADGDLDRRDRIGRVLVELDKALYLSEAGPTGGGPAPTVVANATGCSSVYASTMPFTSYLDPWVNSLFQDAQPLASGIYEGISTSRSARSRLSVRHDWSSKTRMTPPYRARN